MDELASAALLNRGALTRAEAITLGFTDRDLGRAVRCGALRRLRHGVYAAKHAYDAMSEAERHLVLARAVVSAQRGPVALAGPSAAAWHGLRLHEVDLARVHLLRLEGGCRRDHAGAVHRTSELEVETVEEPGGLRITSLARTVWDLAAESSLESSVTAADSALAGRPHLRVELDELATQFAMHRNSRRARLAIRLADGRSGSVGESVTRVKFYRFGIPRPELQFEVRNPAGRLLGVTDFVWEENRHLGEFDGKVKYEKFLKPNEAPGEAVFREKRREDRIRAQGFGMTRIDWAGIMPQRIAQTMAELRGALESSRRTYAA